MLVSWAYKFMNFKTTKDDLDFVVSNLAHCVKSDFANMTLKEVSEAFQNGVKLKYGDFVGGLSTSNFVFFLTKYKEQKQAIAKQLKEYEEKKEAEPSDKEKEKMFQENLKYCIETYRRTKDVDDKGNAVYNRLERDGVISFSEAEKQSVKEFAFESESARLYKELNKSANINEIRSIKQEIKNFNEGRVSLESEVKRLLLCRYLERITKV